MIREIQGHEGTLIIDDRVNTELSLPLCFTSLVDICDASGLYPKKIIIRYATKKERDADAPPWNKDPVYAYVSRGLIVILVDKIKGKKYHKQYLDWILAHEHRHIQQLRNKAIYKELNAIIKVRRKRTPAYEGFGRELSWETVRIAINWRVIIEESDANIFASEWCGYSRPRRIYDD